MRSVSHLVVTAPRLRILTEYLLQTNRLFLSRTMATSSRQQPPWQPPPQPSPECQLPPLKIWNSLTRSKNLFVPIDSKNKTITWYVCGPTVYNDAHLGHARNYATTDIIRRILQDYFKYKVKFVMNITDVDDKVRFKMYESEKSCELRQL